MLEEKLAYLLIAQKRRCFYCDKKLCHWSERLIEKESSFLTRYHFVPLSKGGANRWTNMVLACLACNNAKSGREPYYHEWLSYGYLHCYVRILMQYPLDAIPPSILTALEIPIIQENVEDLGVYRPKAVKKR